jgi:(2Fe-2S) ferredoxin
MRRLSGPRLHLFVCANRREGSPLGPGCGAHGDAVYDALKHDVASRGLVTEVWVTKTHCLGICPPEGATVALYPSREEPIRAGVTAAEASSLLDEPDEADALDAELGALEDLQKEKVLALARRLKPGLTLEDVQNPHDFPELDDPDWHYADGVLAGVQSARSVVRAARRRR